MKDYYTVLGISRKAHAREIKRAYKKLVKKWHPDLHPDEPAGRIKMREINEAYEVLGDPEKKKVYDRRTGEDRLAEGGEAGLHPAPFEDPFLSYFFKVKERLGRKTEKR